MLEIIALHYFITNNLILDVATSKLKQIYVSHDFQKAILQKLHLPFKENLKFVQRQKNLLSRNKLKTHLL